MEVHFEKKDKRGGKSQGGNKQDERALREELFNVKRPNDQSNRTRTIFDVGEQ